MKKRNVKTLLLNRLLAYFTSIRGSFFSHLLWMDIAPCTEIVNRPLPSSKNPHFQNEAKCTTFLVEMGFNCMRMKNHFHIKGGALNLVLIQRPEQTRKWLIKRKISMTSSLPVTEMNLQSKNIN